jgi:dolichol-phosphate mannosyltransferase
MQTNMRLTDYPVKWPEYMTGKDVVVCIPTYNERDNLADLTAEIRLTLPEAIILIIDDASPDGTGVMADGLAALDSKISVLHRERKEGLGPAYLAGFRYSLQAFKPQIIIQMDADFSHPVGSLSLLLQALADHDLALATRYLPGGGTENWSLFRQMISRFGSFYARFWLHLPFRDLTSGFKAWRAGLVQDILGYSISAGGYVFQVETTYLAVRLGAKIIEVPFIFPDRVAGKSKMSARIAFEACWRLPWLALTLKWKSCRGKSHSHTQL